FPALGRVIGRAGPIDAMLQEHESLWRAVDAFSEAVVELGESKDANGEIVARLEKVANHVTYLLSSHIKQEDTMLFPLADKTLDASGKREVDDSVAALEIMYGSSQ
ncbi:MAG: hemerythrin domain-containing protein, partial [Dehalococcoidia bacterium]|nr:hemerythrin domain-containing protein [Dehalococcoidia bacterium]